MIKKLYIIFKLVKSLFSINISEIMIIVSIKEGENIEKALKKFKRKFEKIGITKELRRRQAFIKPSVVRKKQKVHAIYAQKYHQSKD